MTDELRDKIIDVLDLWWPARTGEVADEILAIPEIAAALRQAKMIADEPEYHLTLVYYEEALGHDNFLARLRKAAEQ